MKLAGRRRDLKPLWFVGMCPSDSSDPSRPLLGPSGDRLADLCGFDRATWANVTRRVNLISTREDRWDPVVARLSAWAIWRTLRQRHDVEGFCLVLLGRPVARAFDAGDAPLMRWHRVEPVRPGGALQALGFRWAVAPVDRHTAPNACEVAVVPHPSGLNRWWNDPKNVDAARAFLSGAHLDLHY